ncbi:uncharacterized protein LOC122375774 [Amphibalanus amphitrite]|uniref:uncharacterized protein LOC122375774 n=1 Tax=Amphibalanus amphitrite TaxID=1232801 RepID=UPI001C9141FD|nr:uncharacterized protein LOC122375774 [Amphibalanus amphitrite]
MSSRAQLCDVCLLLVVAAVLVQCSSAFSGLTGIRRSPDYFNDYYRRIVKKRFDEDRPYYRWTPQMFQRYAGTFKRSIPDSESLELCVPPTESCDPDLRSTACCGELQCLPDTEGFSCQSPTAQSEADIRVSGDSESEESESDDSPAGADLSRPSWLGRAPIPFAARDW